MKFYSAKLSFQKTVILSILFFGIFCRFVQYISDRSLWFDEAGVVLAIQRFSFSECIHPDKSTYSYPLGFILVEKMAILALGNQELIVRLFPFICGVLSMFLFKMVVEALLSFRGQCVALGLFAINWHLIYFSSEVKPYSSDLAVALLLIVLFMKFFASPADKTWLGRLAIAGTLSIWFSHPSIFILAGGTMTLILFFLSQRDFKKCIALIPVFGLWALSFLVSYFFWTRHFMARESLLVMWKEHLGSVNGSLFHFLKWHFWRFVQLFVDPAGLYVPALSLFLFVTGVYAVIRRRTTQGMLLLLPLAVAMGFSIINKYPLTGRLAVFVIPILLFFIARGWEYFSQSRKVPARIIAGITLFVVFFKPALYCGGHILRPWKNEEIKPALIYVKNKLQEGDAIYVYYGARDTFRYYQEQLQLKGFVVWGNSSRGNNDGYIQDLAGLEGSRRVWFVFAHVYNKEDRIFLEYLDKTGKRLDVVKQLNVRVYLYDLSRDEEKVFLPKL